MDKLKSAGKSFEISKWEVWEAYRQVKANKGAPGQGCYVDIDDTIKATYGYAKQGAGHGYNGLKGLNALLAIVSTPISAPVVVATRLRRGPANSARPPLRDV
jgi:hypothetical protein